MRYSKKNVKMYSVIRLTICLAICLSCDGFNISAIFPASLVEDIDLTPVHENFGLNIYQFLAKYGYPIESHEVTTEDGYILTLHRIPYGRSGTNALSKNKPIAFFMHALTCSSMDWVNKGPDSSLALILADAGYDVWLANNRGTTWSRKHVSLDPDTDSEYWDFSFDDCGYYDLPAKIDYILNITGIEKINFIGHSQGTSHFFALSSLRPEYNEKIIVAINLAPVAYMHNLTQPVVKFLSKYVTLIEIVFNHLGIHELLPKSEFVMEVSKILCNNNSIFKEVCADLIFFIVGDDPPQLEPTFLQVIASNTPAGISAKMVYHYFQEIKSGYFRRYDYGSKNLKVYNQTTPPNYNISLITAPVALYYGKNDAFAAVVDVEKLADELPNLVKKKLVEYELFNHIDFLWARDVTTLVYDDVINLLNEFNSIS